MKQRLTVDPQDKSRLNVLVRSETMRNVRIVAAELGFTIAKAADHLLRQAILHYVEQQKGERS